MQKRFENTVKQILVVEDEITIAENIQIILEGMGYTVPVIVSSGEEAIKKVKENNPDLILMDIVLYGNMNGIEAAEQIRSYFDIPIVYLTGFADERTLEKAKITEPFGYLIKPFKERELQITIEIALYKHKMEKRLRESNRWLVAVIKSIGDAVIATDTEGTIKLMNPIAEVLTGWKQEDASGKPLTTVFNIISGETDKQIENPVTKAIREDSFYGLADQSVLVTKEGLELPVDIIGSTIKDDRDSIIGIVLIFFDIIERNRAVEALKISTHHKTDCLY
jgi:PAS domain S-box-containing protein